MEGDKPLEEKRSKVDALRKERKQSIWNVQLKPQRPEKVWKAKTETKNSGNKQKTVVNMADINQSIAIIIMISSQNAMMTRNWQNDKRFSKEIKKKMRRNYMLSTTKLTLKIKTYRLKWSDWERYKMLILIKRKQKWLY